MKKKHSQTIIAIGGREDKEGDKLILQEVARRVGKGKLVVSTVASNEPQGIFEMYQEVFSELGLKNVANLEVHDRLEAKSEEKVRVLDDAAAVFFTGGDQLRITSQIGDTPVFERLKQILETGGLLIGTSAGASVVCSSMLIAGDSTESHKLLDTLRMAPGFGFIKSVIIDQHFAARGRMARLLAAVSQNPKALGVGIDENTAIIVEGEERFEVMGEGAVYVVDGEGITYSNVSEAGSIPALSVHDIKVHVLCHGEHFNLLTRTPELPSSTAKAHGG